ncbi:hypothetical protein Pla52n_47580 [Stieleria varia]|uniref:Uncharacterized protein n=1 Tax=Stieleria varia TaxID=2528005 RepID=A0A5C6AG09_9BACT|nr:hypothetical protein Pla52n_47580 [Stieleria varia]
MFCDVDLNRTLSIAWRLIDTDGYRTNPRKSFCANALRSLQ